ncbi:MAG: hypothetical protein RBS72_12885 [Sedimentisphaerales bacterium]|jgi:hypothetical protein|nr:hypothetical protein [Sedimentisphaerales bacterium]HNY78658.1 hypothetical protein [Sedimentisphaerales bacterium]HOC65683.1 hypothetical protein [Sedimentisphaerales bacterium]HOH64640.1 hypothetical protein [Sedimentisphaerales bacterium]HQA91916.1 hypothetical protein [Sedimentisphaerales bacterium]
MKLRKCILLLPTTYNDRTEVPPEVMAGILRSIDEDFDGHTVDGLCDGVYKMADGSMANDKSLKVWIAVDPTRVEELKKLAARFAKVLRQETLYFEVTEAEVEFITPLLETGEAP